MSTSAAPRARAHWGLLVTASAMLMLTMGARQTTGLFVEPIHRQTGIGIASISFALAIGQLVWGAVQPVFGAIADQRGPLPVLMFGGVLLAAGLGLAPWWTSEWGLIVSLGVLAAAGAGAGSFSVLIGATAHRIAPERRSFAAGLINAGGSLGQFVFAPLVQLTIGAVGWAKAMTGLALVSLLTLPLAWPLRRVPSATGAHTAAVAGRSACVRSCNWRCAIAAIGACIWAFHLRRAHRLPGHAPSRRGGAVWFAGQRVGGVDRVDRPVQRGRQPHDRQAGRARPHEVVAHRDVCQPRGDDRPVPDCAAYTTDVLSVRRGIGIHLAGHGAAHGRLDRQAVWPALSGHLVRTDAAVAPARRLLRRVAGRPGAGTLRQLPVDVVRRHRAGRCSGVGEPADS